MNRTNSEQRQEAGPMTLCLRALATSVIATGIYLSGMLDPLERGIAELRFGLADRPASGLLTVVGIDDATLRQFDTDRMPTEFHAIVVDRLVEAGAYRIALDVDLAAPSGPDADSLLGEALARADGRVILPVFRGGSAGPGTGEATAYARPVLALQRQARMATVDILPDEDGLVRRSALTRHWQNGFVSTMAAELAGLGQANFRTFHIDYGIRADTLPRLSYTDVLTGRFDPAAVRGRSVIVGVTHGETSDLVPVPAYGAIPGSLLQALTFESIVQNRLLRHSSPWLAVAGILLIAAGLARPLQSGSWRFGLVVVGGIAGGLLVLSFALQLWTPVMLEVGPWIVAALLSWSFVVASRIEPAKMAAFAGGLRRPRSDALMRRIVESSSDAIVAVSGDMVVALANPAAEAVFGFDAQDLVGRKLSRIFPALDSVDRARDFFGAGHRVVELQGRCSDGSFLSLEATVDSMRSGSTDYYVVAARDVTERQAQQKLLEYLALHDTLTGLPNRTLIMDRLEHAITASRRDGTTLALLLLDLDRFKEINDTLGHAVGDSLLSEIGQLLGAPLRASDTIARLGGDEFAVLLPRVANREQAHDIANRIASSIARPFPVGDLLVDVGVSIGVALYPDHGTTASELFRSADVAMYTAKRDRAVVADYEPDRDHNSVRNLSIGGELRLALERDDLSMLYQPQVDFSTGRLAGAEALLRWEHTRHGPIQPQEFISLAEHTGIIRPLTQWVTDNALRQIAAWRTGGLEVRLSLNLSPRNLNEDDLAQRVADLLSRYDIPAGNLTFEITEGAIMTDPNRTLRAIRSLKECGVRLAIDDFGTGYSSLAYLKALPVDELKIDKSFVRQLADDGNDEVIVRSTIDLAHNLGLSVVAEGVENEQHLHTLLRLGCDVGQGYFLGRPADAESFRTRATGPADAAERRFGWRPEVLTGGRVVT